MGVRHLHDVMIPHVTLTNLKVLTELKGQKVGVDVSGYEMKEHRRYRYTDFVQYMVDVLKEDYDITCVLVFDGKTPLPKGQNQAGGRMHYSDDYDAEPFVWKVAHEVFVTLRYRGVEAMIAPNEADSQLCYLALTNYVAAVITEDSDLFAFKCPRIIFKLNIANGVCCHFKYDWKDKFCKFPAESAPLPLYNRINLRLLTPAMFVHFCILCHSSYLDNIHSIGPAHAYTLVKGCGGNLQELFGKLQTYAKHHLPSEVDSFQKYKERFEMAVETYEHQMVFCPKERIVKHLRDINDKDDGVKREYLGSNISKDKAIKVVAGLINPISLEPFPNDQLKADLTRNVENEKYIKSTRYEKFKGDLGPSDKYKKLRTCVSMFGKFTKKKNGEASNHKDTGGKTWNAFLILHLAFCLEDWLGEVQLACKCGN